MAILFDSCTAQALGDTTPQTFSHTVGSGSNGILIVFANYFNNTDGTNAITGITYNGLPLTFFTFWDGVDQTTHVVKEFWYLLTPTSGTHSLVVTFSGAKARQGLSITSVSYFNVDQASPIEQNTGQAASQFISASTSDLTLTFTTFVSTALMVTDFYTFVVPVKKKFNS